MKHEEVGPNPKKYALPIAFYYRHYWRLVDFLQQDERPVLGEIDTANPLLRFKIFGPYRYAGLSVEQRTDKIIDHYNQAESLLGTAMFHTAHAAAGGAFLCNVDLPDGHGSLPVRLTRYPRLRREGELSVALHDPFGTLLYTLTFSFESASNTRRMFIGSMISETTIDNIRHLTKLMHGLRPQALMLFIAQAICRSLALDSLLAVGRQGHIFAGTDLAERLQFDYDRFWQEHGGIAQIHQAGIYEIPLHSGRRPEADIPSRKRAQYRRRNLFLDSVERNVHAGLTDRK